MTRFTDQSTDEELVEAARAGDFDAYTVLVRRFSDRVYRLAWSFVKSEHEAEDVVQETFLNVYRALDRFQGNSKLGSWIYRITVNTALMRLRRKRRRPEVTLEATRPAGSAAGHHESPMLVDRSTPEESAARSELGAEIQAAVDALDERNTARSSCSAMSRGSASPRPPRCSN